MPIGLVMVVLGGMNENFHGHIDSAKLKISLHHRSWFIPGEPKSSSVFLKHSFFHMAFCLLDNNKILRYNFVLLLLYTIHEV